MKFKLLARALAGLILAASAGLACAQAYPVRPVRMIIAFPPGGPTDIVARVIAQQLSMQMGQQVVVDNKPGAGGNIAAEQAARALPDGYTIFYNTSAIVIGPALYAKVNYDTLKDYAPVVLTAAIPMVLMVNPGLAPKNVREFIDLARAQPGKLNYGSSGTGTITHLASAMFSTQAGIQTQHVPYKGSAPALIDLAAGQVQFMTDTINTGLPYIKDGRMRGLAVTSLKRSAVLPELPTFDESGLKGFDAAAWQGIVVPTGTPPEIISRLNAETNRALQNADVRARLAAQGSDTLGSTPAEYAAYIRSEMPRWTKAVKDSGAKAE